MEQDTRRRLANYRAKVRRKMASLPIESHAIPRHVRLAQVAILDWSLQELHENLVDVGEKK
jgi:hypothetical protein